MLFIRNGIDICHTEWIDMEEIVLFLHVSNKTGLVFHNSES